MDQSLVIKALPREMFHHLKAGHENKEIKNKSTELYHTYTIAV
jgi:hypothetical protein